ncbi:hypothetical protein [Peribacillus sp. NPDC097225]|uniref:hypothetical protein n=1 Tax=Peribacillus sp. NPDC097225 TaxID=3364400 RepID=UPI0038266BC4
MAGNWWKGFTEIIKKIKTNDLKKTLLDVDKIERNNKMLAQFLDLAIVEERAQLSLELHEIIDLELWDQQKKLTENFVLEVKNMMAGNPSFMLAIKKYEEVIKSLSKAIEDEDFLKANDLKREELDIQENLLSLWAKYYLKLASNHGLLSENISDEETIEMYLKSYIKA